MDLDRAHPEPAKAATPPATAAEAIKELREAVEGGNDMPWSMVGVRWTTAKRLLDIIEGGYVEPSSKQ